MWFEMDVFETDGGLKFDAQRTLSNTLMSDSVIHVEGLGKRYRIGERERYRALRDVLARAFTAPLKRRTLTDFLWALRGVNLDVAQGEVVGLIGRNGSGKTTLLKLLSRITHPQKASPKSVDASAVCSKSAPVSIPSSPAAKMCS
jgi:ABC-type glutathione transport system ATPase component